MVTKPGHEGVAGNETADRLTRTATQHPFIGPEPTRGASTGVAKGAVRDWTNSNHQKLWESTTVLKQAK
jgi:ribonuclease HI